MRTNYGSLRAGMLLVVAIASAAAGKLNECQAQPYLPLYEGPAFDGTNGFRDPRFNHNEGGGQLRLAPGKLLNNAGTAAWHAIVQPNETVRAALRWQPSSGPFVGLDPTAVYLPENTAYSYPYAINAGGTVVGTSHSYIGNLGIPRPVKWEPGGTAITVMQAFGGGGGQPPYGLAWGINDNGYAVGWSTQYDPDYSSVGDRPARWDPAGNIMELEAIASYPIGDPIPVAHIADGEAYTINNSNVAVGYGVLYVGNDGAFHGYRAVRWDAAGDATVLGHLGTSSTGSTTSEAWFINDDGDVVGYAVKYDGSGNNDGARAVRWNNSSTAAIELEILGADTNGVSNTHVYAFNDAGTAVGLANEYEAGIDDGQRAVLWDAAGQVTELGHFSSFEFSEAYDINENGVVVGIAQKSAIDYVAAYWDSSGNPVDLNTLIAPGSGWSLYQALAISDTGWIVGTGFYDPPGDQSAYERVFMLQLPAEPELPGDYNDDGTVNAADYTVWRDNSGASVTLPNDTTPGSVIAFDYEVWSANFGDTIGDGSGTNVPEPATLMLAAIVLAAAFSRQVLYARRFCVLVAALFACSNAVAIDIETLLVGDAGNPADNREMNDDTCCYGAVAYEYRIGKYEVTNDQFAVFLNAIGSTDTNEIYEPFFMGAANYGGILRSGGAPNYTYTVKPNMGNKPVFGVTPAAAMRFANWLHNGQPSGSQTTATTEAGTYDLTGTSLPLARSASATWWIPNDDEWYKAAYYDPRDTASGGPPGNYWLYATKSLGIPTAATADAMGNIANPGSNTVNYNSAANWNGSEPFGNFTTVGSAGLTSASYYGTFDQSGNAGEINDTPTQFGPNTRVVRGGQYNSLSDAISAEVRGYCPGCYAGFRVASVLDPPDPDGGLLAYWNAENGAVDVTGNGHDGTFQGNAMTMSGGPFGNAFAFDGSGDYIDIGDELDMGTSDFTLSAWVNGDPTMNQWGRIFDKGFASGYALGRQANSNTIAFEFLASGSQGNTFDTSSVLIDNTWHHVALVKSGTSVTIYADGTLENTETVSGAAQNNSRPLRIGYNPGEGILGYWKGKLDELKIFGRALAPSEIAALALNPNEELDGDYNNDGTVNAADYTVWRDHLGANVTLPNDSTPGFVTSSDYDEWKANFGATQGEGSGATVPEPSTLVVAVLGVMALYIVPIARYQEKPRRIRRARIARRDNSAMISNIQRLNCF